MSYIIVAFKYYIYFHKVLLPSIHRACYAPAPHLGTRPLLLPFVVVAAGERYIVQLFLDPVSYFIDWVLLFKHL